MHFPPNDWGIGSAIFLNTYVNGFLKNITFTLPFSPNQLAYWLCSTTY